MDPMLKLNREVLNHLNNNSSSFVMYDPTMTKPDGTQVQLINSHRYEPNIASKQACEKFCGGRIGQLIG